MKPFGRRKTTVALAMAAAAVVLAAGQGRARAQMPDLDKTQIKTTKVADGVYMLEGAGGNIGVSAGEDGVFVIDDEFAPLAPKIKAAIAAISKKPIRFLFNTHWHGDHTGGNEPMAAGGAIIVAHDNVRKRLSTDQFSAIMNKSIPAAPAKALPVITFNDEVAFHLNGDDIHVVHVAAAHTDGDAILHFTKANVVHTGDVFINGMYPVIDISSGGSIDGYLAAQEKMLAHIDAATKLIPGHGPLGDKAGLQKAHDVLKTVRDRIAKLVAQKKTVDQIKAAKPSAEFDADWGKGFIKADLLVDVIFQSLTAAKPEPAVKHPHH